MFVNYEPEFTYAKQSWTVDFEFKTQKTDGFLLGHTAVLHNKIKNIVEVLLIRNRVTMRVFEFGILSNNVTLTLQSQQGKYFINLIIIL